MTASLDRVQPPKFKPFKSFKLKEAESFNLQNGVDLHVVSAGSQPVCQIELIFKAGVRHESHYGQAYFAGKLLKEGTSALTSKEISAFFDQYGAFLEIQPGLDKLTVSLYSLTKHLEILIPFLKTVLYEAIFPANELAIQKNIKIQNIKVENDKNNVLASKILRSSLFGEDHEYGRTLNEQHINELGREDLLQFHKDNIVNNLEILASGNIKENHIKIIEANFGQIPISPTKIKGDIGSYQLQTINQLIERQESLQSSIRLGKHMIAKNHEDYVKLSVVTELLGGYFGSRLMKNIREEKGYTYGIHATMVNLQKANYFIIGTDVKKEFTADTIGEIQKEIDRLQREPVPQNELETVKNYLLGTFQSSITSPFSLMEKFKSVHFYELGYDYFNNYVKAIQSINQDDILQLSLKYLKVDSLSEIIVGGKTPATA